ELRPSGSVQRDSRPPAPPRASPGRRAVLAGRSRRPRILIVRILIVSGSVQRDSRPPAPPRASPGRRAVLAGRSRRPRILIVRQRSGSSTSARVGITVPVFLGRDGTFV